MSNVSFVIVAAGRSERYGGPPKVMEIAASKPVITWSIEAAMATASVRDVVVVTSTATEGGLADIVAGGRWERSLRIVTGGARRQDSVLAGIEATDPRTDAILIHDGARPLVTPGMIEACVASTLACGAAIVAVPVTDTIKRVDQSGVIIQTVPRSDLWAAQTPQGFRRDVLARAIADADLTGTEYTDEALLCEALGIPVSIVPASGANLKLTLRADLDLISYLLAQRQQPAPELA